MNPWLSITICVLSPLLWIVFGMACLVFWIYRKCIDITLRIKFGNKYGGLLNYCDAFTIFHDKSKLLVNCNIVYRSDTEVDIVKFIRTQVQEKIFDKPDDYPKMTSTLHLYRGYAYWLKNSVNLDECLKIVPAPSSGTYNEDYAKIVAGDIFDKPLPQNDTAIWEINIFDKPVIAKEGKKQIFHYTIVMRFHHVIGDGIAINNLLGQILASQFPEQYGEEIFNQKLKANSHTTESLQEYFKKLIKQVLLTLQTIFYLIFFMLQQRLELVVLRKPDENALHRPSISGKKLIAWTVEESVEFVPMVKRIKNRVPNVKFSHVVLAAITASFANYFRRKGHKVPDTVTSYLTMLLEYPKFDRNKPVNMRNSSTAALLELPVGNTEDLHKTLQNVRENAKRMSYFEALSNQIFIRYMFAFFPKTIRTYFQQNVNYTTMISNVPGGALVRHTDYLYVENVIACLPNLMNVGITILTFTYDNRFQIAVLVDRSLISSQEDAQSIVDGIFDSFRRLDVECQNMERKNT